MAQTSFILDSRSGKRDSKVANSSRRANSSNTSTLTSPPARSMVAKSSSRLLCHVPTAVDEEAAGADA